MKNPMFNSILPKKVGSNKFDLSREHKISFNMGELIPCYLEEIVPGDKFRVSTDVFLRFAPMVAPIMHRVNVYVHYFFVPNRLIWEDWEDFITGGEDGLDASSWPRITYTNTDKAYFVKGRLSDYFGLPITDGLTITQNMSISCLPHRAYQLIYNEYYRDQNLTSEIDFGVTSGTQSAYLSALTTVRKRCWERDYFTSCLPWTQRGVESELDLTIDWSAIAQFYDNTGSSYSGGNVRTFEHSTTGQLRDTTDNVSGTLRGIDSINMTINDLRTAVKLQEFLERNARGGSRYIENVLSHFGVMGDDARYHRPKYLGGGMQPVSVSEVLNTNGSYADTWSDVSPLGTMGGHAISVGGGNGFTEYFKEHGFVMGIISVLPKTAYQQGVHRMFFRNDKTEYYFPEFANLGEQDVQNQEIYYDHTGAAVLTDTFGYQSRYSEYKYGKSIVCGDFRDDFEYWHMGRQFSSAPSLNTSFVEADPTHRIFAVTTSTVHKIYGQLYHKVDALRPMPIFGEPGL